MPASCTCSERDHEEVNKQESHHGHDTSPDGQDRSSAGGRHLYHRAGQLGITAADRSNGGGERR